MNFTKAIKEIKENALLTESEKQKAMVAVFEHKDNYDNYQKEFVALNDNESKETDFENGVSIDIDLSKLNV